MKDRILRERNTFQEWETERIVSLLANYRQRHADSSKHMSNETLRLLLIKITAMELTLEERNRTHET